MTNGKRDYQKQKENYDGTNEQKKKRAARNAARAKLMREGKVKKGDGKHVDHKNPLSKGGSNKRSNLRVVDGKKNMSFARKRDGSIK
jgi:5-methylcytosine-specific restriction endonuclease McrA